MTRPDLPRRVTDPDGRIVEFNEWAWTHIIVERPQLLGDVDVILGVFRAPKFRESDPIPGREQLYRRCVTDEVRWLRVVVDFNHTPAVVVTAFIQLKI